MHLACQVGPNYGCNPKFLGKKTKSEKIYHFFVKEKKNREGRRKKYLEKENIFWKRGNNTFFFRGEGKKCSFLEEKKKECNIWRKNNYFFGEEKKNGEGKGEK